MTPSGMDLYVVTGTERTAIYLSPASLADADEASAFAAAGFCPNIDRIDGCVLSLNLFMRAEDSAHGG